MRPRSIAKRRRGFHIARSNPPVAVSCIERRSLKRTKKQNSLRHCLHSCDHQPHPDGSVPTSGLIYNVTSRLDKMRALVLIWFPSPHRSLQGGASPLWPTRFSVYASPLLFTFATVSILFATLSARGATLDTGGWLALTSNLPNLSPDQDLHPARSTKLCLAHTMPVGLSRLTKGD